MYVVFDVIYQMSCDGVHQKLPNDTLITEIDHDLKLNVLIMI